MILSVTFEMLKMIVTLLKYPFYALIIFIAIFSFLISVNIVICLSKGKKFKKRDMARCGGTRL